jgi:hypothetical protein
MIREVRAARPLRLPRGARPITPNRLRHGAEAIGLWPRAGRSRC